MVVRVRVRARLRVRVRVRVRVKGTHLQQRFIDGEQGDFTRCGPAGGVGEGEGDGSVGSRRQHGRTNGDI